MLPVTSRTLFGAWTALVGVAAWAGYLLLTPHWSLLRIVGITAAVGVGMIVAGVWTRNRLVYWLALILVAILASFQP